MLINPACELKGQFNIDCQWCVYRTMVPIIREVRISGSQIIRAILYIVIEIIFRDLWKERTWVHWTKFNLLKFMMSTVTQQNQTLL